MTNTPATNLPHWSTYTDRTVHMTDTIRAADGTTYAYVTLDTPDGPKVKVGR